MPTPEESADVSDSTRAVVGPHLGLGAPGDVDLHALAGLGLLDHRGGQLHEIAHQAVPPERDPGDAQGGLPAADRHALPVLAAGARRHVEVVGHGIDAAQHLGAVPDQVGVAQRLGDVPVLDEVGLGGPEDEVTGRRC